MKTRLAGRTPYACLVGLIFAFASAPALAQTEAACQQEYATKQMTREADGQTQASYAEACLARPTDSRAENIANHDTEKLSNTDLAKESQNPIGNLYIVPFNNYTTFGFGPNGQSRGTQNVLEIQPVIPIHLNEEWNIITRGVMPLVWTPNLSPVPTVSFGVAPTDVTAFLAPRHDTDGWLWGVGPVVQAPTISSARLGSSVWGGGPAGVIVYTRGKIVAGALVNTIWSFGGTPGPLGNSYNTSLFEPFFNYNFEDGWSFYSDPNITANWEARGPKWTVPLGGGIAKITKIGKLPIKLDVGVFYNVARPTFGGRWVLNTAFALIF
jgi:hypothetical protein